MQFSRNIFGWGVVTLGLATCRRFGRGIRTERHEVVQRLDDDSGRDRDSVDHLESVVQDPAFSKPAGNMTSDLPLKMIVSPDGKLLLAACGYNNTGLAVLDMAAKKILQFFPLPQVWNGLAFSGDGSAFS